MVPIPWRKWPEATRKRVFSYLGITDHSQSASYAGGMKAAEVSEQMMEPDSLNKQYGWPRFSHF
jgi:DNA polymerase (family X)